MIATAISIVATMISELATLGMISVRMIRRLEQPTARAAVTNSWLLICNVTDRITTANRSHSNSPSTRITTCSDPSKIDTTASATSTTGIDSRVVTMNDIDRRGLASVAEEAIAVAGRGTASIHVSFDLDACDPAIAPGVGTPVKGGLNYREAHILMELIAESGKLKALDLVEVNPIVDTNNMTAHLATELALSALGKTIL